MTRINCIYFLCFSLRYWYPSFINCTFVIPISFKKEEIFSYNSRGIIVWKLLFVSLRCSLFFSSYFLRDCLRAVFYRVLIFVHASPFCTEEKSAEFDLCYSYCITTHLPMPFYNYAVAQIYFILSLLLLAPYHPSEQQTPHRSDPPS